MSKLFLFLLLPQINCGFNGLRLGNVKTSFAAALGWHHCCGKPNFFIMIDTTQLTQLISAFRVETEKESISPETVGSLLQNITDLLANASSSTEQQIFENWKAILSQLNLVEDIGIGVEGVESVNIAISLRDLANGGHSARLFNIPSATPLRAGVMTAQQANTLMSLDAAVGALELAVVNIGNKNAEQDSRLDIIQGGHSVITAITQGDDHPSKVYFNIRKQNLATGEEYNKSNNKEIAPATNEKAGVMTKAHVQALEKAAQDIGNLRQHIDLLRQPQMYVTGVYNRPHTKDSVYLGVEFTDVWTGDIIEAGDDIEIPGATAQQAGVMTAKHAKRLDDAERDIFNLKKASANGGQPMYHISAEVNNEEGNHLVIKGAKQLLDMGYIPYLFRFSKKSNRLYRDNYHGPVRKGWNRVGQSKGAIKIDNGGNVSIDVSVLKHTEIDLTPYVGEDSYQRAAKWFVDDRMKNGYRYTSFGKSRIRITYRNANRELKTHKVRLTFGIAFSKQETRPREKFDMGSLVSNMAVFHVATDPKEAGTRYTWIFEK